jgi:hypothetical protein
MLLCTQVTHGYGLGETSGGSTFLQKYFHLICISARRAKPLALLFGAAVAAFAQAGTIDTSSFQAAATLLAALFTLIGAVGVLAGLSFAIFKFIGRDIGGAVLYVIGAIAGGIVIGYARTWAASLTGVAL